MGLPALRDDAPARRERTRGHLPALGSIEERDEAISKLKEDFYSASHRRTRTWKWQTIEKALAS